MAERVVDSLEPVEIDQRDRAWRPAAAGARNLFTQHPHDAAAVIRARQFIEFGQFFDASVGFLELESALVERLTDRVREHPEKHAASDGEDEDGHGVDAVSTDGLRQWSRA